MKGYSAFPKAPALLEPHHQIVYCHIHIFVAASHQTRLDTRSKARRPIKVGIKGRGRSGRSRDSNPACLCCSSAHLVQCGPDEASSFTNPNVGPGTYASLRLKLDAWSSAVQIQDTRLGGLTPLQRSSRCILQPQPTGQNYFQVQTSVA